MSDKKARARFGLSVFSYTPGARVKKFQNLSIIGLDIIKKHGIRAFLGKFKGWLFKRSVDTSRVPLLDIPITSGSRYSVEKSLAGRFLFPADNLFEVRLYTLGRDDNCSATLLIRDGAGHLLRETSLDSPSIKENGYTSFNFAPIKGSRGKTFNFKLMVRDGKLAVSYDRSYISERLELLYDDTSLKGAIGFQAFGNAGRKTLYDIWILKNEPVASELERHRDVSKSFNYRPKVSVVTPVYNPEVAWIKAAVESVLAQTYDNWELCLADASTKGDVKECLRSYASEDSRIKVRFLENNLGIAANSNEALSLATGEYVALLDHDDELSPDALYEIVKLLQDHPDADMIYSDEDKIDIGGNRSSPFFKPDWSQDTFLSYMYTCHVGVYRKKLVDEIGGFREGFEGSQDYDLTLRIIEKAGKICHVPKVLYHWRTTPGSTATDLDKKGYAHTAGEKAITDYLRRNGIDAVVEEGAWPTSYRVKRKILYSPLVSVIIPTRDNVDVLRRCIDSIIGKTDYKNFEIIVVNNDSKDKETYGYFEELREKNIARVLEYDHPFNFSAINDMAAKAARGDVLLFLNNDMEVIDPGWLSAMLEHAQRKEVGAVGCKLLYPNGMVQHAGVILGLTGGVVEKGVAGHSHKWYIGPEHGYFGRVDLIQDVSAVTAACMMVRRDVFEEVGGFDENLSIAFNDVDLCLKIRRKGYLIVYTPYASLYHHESYSRGYEDTPEKIERFEKEVKLVRGRWGGVIDAGDPYYSPNLTLDREDFSIKT
ncbi:MAG TPA: glycosyltransferase [Methanocella sp.]|uniref:glycosyltransferase family 2 protein n=1 Tax=Methanocella sp. TaxID=2052833 RepID=UPI002C8CA64F|nr:glycosyltransferase [Methanocella sp.]HTY91172.1 glycosyltransferase [Methanocella sp.]